ncbi:MAG: type IV toxin-antitoxin system AbiEi family antitoxin domain-containing protein [Pseudohongiellaceae bacterium]
MQPLRLLTRTLADLAGVDHYLFTPSDLRALLPDLSDPAFKTLLSRAVSNGDLVRVCRGIYLYPRADYPRGLVLFHTAARLRADGFNYISLETALSDAGAISQIPMNWITLMSSGRSSIVRCGDWGTIEFVHTAQLPADLANELEYDSRCHLWRTTVQQALRDMRVTQRNMELVDRDLIDKE